MNNPYECRCPECGELLHSHSILLAAATMLRVQLDVATEQVDRTMTAIEIVEHFGKILRARNEQSDEGPRLVDDAH